MHEAPASPPLIAKKRRRIFPVILLVVLLLAGIAVGAWMWYNRPIRPVVLDATEKQRVEAKLAAIQGEAPATPPEREPAYEKGSKEIILTEREINGLLNENTPLGNSVQLQLATGAVHARVETDLNPDLPIVGGKRLQARAKLIVGSDPAKPELILDDVTVWGISLPNEWLGQMKGKNLLGEALGDGSQGIPGIEELRIEKGKLIVRLKD
ncbi:MAG: hypothetical protein V4733_01730 [Verrucomicrobiota bacterium]